MGPEEESREQRDSTETLTNAFERVLAARFGRTTTLARVSPLAGDASSRRYFRLALSGGAEVPASVVAMVLGPDRLPLSSEELSVFEKPPTELPFVNVGRFLSRIGVRIPKLHAHASEDGILLLEDVGDESLRSATESADEPRVLHLYREAVDQLVHIQVLGTRHADSECVAFQQRFDDRLFAWEFDHFLEYGLPEGPVSEHARLRDAFSPVIEQLSAAPAVLAHRDFHAWNLHVHCGAVWVIDFQDALLGPAMYDMASLLTDRDTATIITPAREDALITYYLQARQGLGSLDDDVPTLRTQYFLCVLQRALKVLGRFQYLARVKGKPGYMRYLPHVARQARRALDATPEVSRLREALLPHLVTACAP